jgi:GNAT superfamily N-acetyltransferase
MRTSIEPDTLVRSREQLSYLETIYPGFRHWFDNKVQPGLVAGTRYLDVFEHNEKLAGIVIAKNEDGEKKLCTVWVHPDFRGHGIGIRLIKAACLWLGTDRPLASVSEVNFVAVDGLLKRLGFLHTSSKMNPQTGLIEHFYNETKRENDHVQSGFAEIAR